MNALNLALWEGMCCGCGHRNCSAHVEQTASMPGACICLRNRPCMHHGGGTPAVRRGDILPSAFRDHGLNSEGVSGLHHSSSVWACG